MAEIKKEKESYSNFDGKPQSEFIDKVLAFVGLILPYAFAFTYSQDFIVEKAPSLNSTFIFVSIIVFLLLVGRVARIICRFRYRNK